MSTCHHLQSIVFTKDFRNWKKGESIAFPRGITALVGMNGCGKSTVIDLLREHFNLPDPTHMSRADKSAVNVTCSSESFPVGHHDFHGGDMKFAAVFGGDIMTQLQAQNCSSGIAGIVQFNASAARKVTDGLLLLDEPCRGLALKSQRMMGDLIERSKFLGNNQVVLATHSPIIMAIADSIYSVEHRRFFASPEEFIEEHMKENKKGDAK